MSFAVCLQQLIQCFKCSDFQIGCKGTIFFNIYKKKRKENNFPLARVCNSCFISKLQNIAEDVDFENHINNATLAMFDMNGKIVLSK